MNRGNKAIREDLGARSLGVSLVTEGNRRIFVGRNVAPDHGWEKEAVAVGRVEGCDLALGGCQGEEGC